MKENILIDKSIAFAARIIKLHQYLIKTKKETIISKQIVRSGTSIGANINEANYGQSKADFVSNDNLFNYQAKVIKELAETESCIIVGRAADFVLKDHPDVTRVHVYADEKFCLERSKEFLGMFDNDKEVLEHIEKTDKFRGDYYKYYTGKNWDDARNYDLCLNSGVLGFEKTVEEIKAYLKVRFGENVFDNLK